MRPRHTFKTANQRIRLGLAGLGVVLLMVLLMALLKGPADIAAPTAREPLAQLGVAPGGREPQR